MSRSTLSRRHTFTSSLSSIRENPATNTDNNIQISAPEQAIQKAIRNGTTIKKQVAALLTALKSINPNPGLSTAQAINFQQLKKKRKRLKEMRQHQEQSFLIDKRITYITKKIAPLKQRLFFWARGLNQLNDADFWSVLEEKLDNPHLKLRLYELKKLWQSQQNFSRFTTQELLNFNVKYLQPLRETVRRELDLEKYLPKNSPASNYLEALNLAINKLRAQFVDAILVRLLCVEYYDDICCDDIVCYFLDRITELTGIPSTEPLVLMRRDLNPDIIHNLVTILEKYYKHEDYLKALLPKLTVPDLYWKQIGAIRDPVVIFFNNSFPKLIENLLEHDYVLLNQLVNDIFEDKNNPHQLIKMRELLTYMQVFCEKHQATRCDDALKKTLEIQLKNYTAILEYINQSLEKKLYKLIKSFLHNLNSTHIKKEIWERFGDKLKNIKQFHNQYFKTNYYPNNDWLFIIAIYTFDLIKEKHEISTVFCKNIVKFYSVMNVMTEKQINLLKTHFNELLVFANKLNYNEPETTLHLIAHYLELPLLKLRLLPMTLKRHKAIERLFQKEETIPDVEEELPVADQLQLLILYMQNVWLKIFNAMSYINLDYFDHHDLFSIEQPKKRMLEKIKSNAEIQEENFIKLKESLEKQLSYKLNNALIFTKYLGIGHKIDLNKLANLIKRIAQFFKNNQYKSFVLEMLKESVSSHIKKYCLDKLRTNQPINVSYIRSINEILNINILEQFKHHEEFEKLVTKLSQRNDTPPSLLTFLLINAFAKENPIIINYAKNRLAIMRKSKAATPEDYLFFSYFAKVSSISERFNAEKNKHAAIIYERMNEDFPWQEGFACLVELFGTNKLIYAYRLKGIRWLLTLAESEVSALEGTQHFKAFMNTLNQAKNSKNTLGSAIPKNKLLVADLNKCIENYKWSPLLENILREWGSLEQTQTLHTNLLREVIESKVNFSDTWLGQVLKDKIGYTLNNKQAFYLHFFGAKNIKTLCHLLEQSIKDLISINENINIRHNEKINPKTILDQALGILPLVDFYQTNGRDQSTLHFLETIQNFIHKIYSYQKLCINLNCNADLIRMAELSPKFHSAITSITLHLDELKSFNQPTQDEIETYLKKLKEIFRELEDCLQEINVVLTFMVVANLYNLLLSFSEKLKSLLANKYKHEFNKNPHWQTLITNLDDKKQVQRIEHLSLSLTTHQVFSVEFQSVLDFAQRFNTLKIKIQDYMKQSLLYEAGIHLQRLESNWSNSVKGKKLLLLWKICVCKLHPKQLPSEFEPEYVQFLLDFIKFITDAILQRAKTCPDLVEKLISLFIHLDQAKTTIISYSTPNTDARRPARLSLLFTSMNAKPLDINCLYTLMNKTYALSFILKITQFLAQFEMKQITQAKSLSPHTSSSVVFYQSKEHPNYLQLRPLTDILELLQRLYNGQETQKEILDKVEKIYLEATNNLGLTENKTYFKFLKKLYKNLQTFLQTTTEGKSNAPKSKRFSIALT